MTFQLWLGVFGAIALTGLVSFLYFFVKDSALRVKQERKATVLLVDGGLLFVALIAIAAAIFLYIEWQAQLSYFLDR